MSTKTIEQISNECLLLAKSSPSIKIKDGALFKWKGKVTKFINGELNFQCVPHYGFAISDGSHSIPCIIQNPLKNVNKLLQLCNNAILLKEPVFLVETFATGTKECSVVYLLLNVENIHVMEKNFKLRTSSTKKFKKSSSVENINTCSNEEWYQSFVPSQISAATLTLKSEMICFVLAFLNRSESETFDPTNEHVWLILTGNQVWWKDLLLSNQTYTIVLPENVPKNYFNSNLVSLSSVIHTNLSLEDSFRQILHHREMIQIDSAIYLPQNCKIYTTSQIPTNFPFVGRYFSISDKKLPTVKFASIYGIITGVNYVDSYKSLCCMWCEKQNAVFEANKCDIEYSQCDDDNVDWFTFSTFVADTNEKIWLPEVPVKIPECRPNGFGIKNNMCVQITLRDYNTNKSANLYVKRWDKKQYPIGLVPGVYVCFTNVNVRCSMKMNSYFIATPLTRIMHLDTIDLQTLIASEGKFGFGVTRFDEGKIWGFLELEMLQKVSIISKCKLCGEKFWQYSCSNRFCSNNVKKLNMECEVIATARLFVRGFVGCECSSLYLKNEHVRTYLNFPNDIWEHLCRLSANDEILYLRRKCDPLADEMDVVSIFFYTYCCFYRPKMRFHVVCRPFRNNPMAYFCIDLIKIDEKQLLITRSIIENAMKKNRKESVDENDTLQIVDSTCNI